MDKGVPKGTWQRAYDGKSFAFYPTKTIVMYTCRIRHLNLRNARTWQQSTTGPYGMTQVSRN